MYIVRNGWPHDRMGYACTPPTSTSTVHGPKERAIRFATHDEAMQWILDRAIKGHQTAPYWRVVRLVKKGTDSPGGVK